MQVEVMVFFVCKLINLDMVCPEGAKSIFGDNEQDTPLIMALSSHSIKSPMTLLTTHSR